MIECFFIKFPDLPFTVGFAQIIFPLLEMLLKSLYYSIETKHYKLSDIGHQNINRCHIQNYKSPF